MPLPSLSFPTFLFLLTSNALGASPLQEPDLVLSRPRGYERALDASVRIGGSSSTSLCSGVILGRNGYVATAAHCLNRLLERHWNDDHYTQAPVVERRIGKAGYYTARSFTSPLPSSEEMAPGSVLAEFGIDAPGFYRPQLAWIGAGIVNVKEERLAELDEAEFSVLPGLVEDVAILKYAEYPSDAPCMPIADRDPAPGDELWALGFPARPPAFNGYREAVSSGKVRGSLEDDPVLQEIAGALDDGKRALFWLRENRLWNRPGRILLSDLDVATGNSGGMMVNARGQLAGIVFSVMRVDPSYNGSTSMGVSSLWLRERVASTAGEAAARQIFSCAE